MQFTAKHIIRGINQADFERLYFDEPFNIALCQKVGLGRSLISLQKNSSLIIRKVQVTPQREIPAPVQKLLGGERISYTETVTYTLGSGQGMWQTESSILTQKISSDGKLFIVPAKHGDGPAVEREVTGHVTVRIFGLGGVVERFIVHDVQNSYAQAAQFTESYLASK